jgi:peptide/nickel transport system substrate-binding protein
MSKQHRAVGSGGNRWSRRRLLGATGAGLGTAAFLAACGGSKESESTASNTTAATPVAGGTAQVANATAAPEGKPGGTLHLAMDRDPVSLDPHIEASYRTLWTIGGVYNKPLRLTSDLKVTMDLAESFEQPDPTTLVLKLRKGVKFHNVAPASGREMTAEDVIYSISRIRTPKPEFQRGYMFEAISDMQATDASTVRIKLSQPFAPLLNYIANPFTVIVPREVVEAKGDLRSTAVGTGPFTLAEAQQGVAYKLAKNPAYWQSGRPYLDGTELRIIPDPASRVSAFRAKQLDLEQMEDQDVQEFKKDRSVSVQETAQGGWYSVRYNTTKPPFNDPRLRKAIDLVIDRKDIIALVAGGAGAPMGPVSPSLGDWALADADLEKLPGYRSDKTADIAEAKKLIAAAGVADFPPPLLFYIPAQIDEQIAVAMQQQLIKAGINAKLEKVDYAAWTPRLLKKDFFFTMAPSGFRDNPDEYLYALFYSTASRNDTGYANPEVDRMLDAQRTELDEAKRKKLVVDIQKKLLETELPNSWLYTSNVNEAMYPYVKGYKVTYSHNRSGQLVDMWFDK